MHKLCFLLLTLYFLQQVGLCQAGILNWLLGRPVVPSLSNDKNFNTLIKETNKLENTEGSGSIHEKGDVSFTPTDSIKFELTTADEKFIQDAKKYTDLISSELDLCQHKIVLQLKSDCGDLTEEDLSKLGVNLLNCQSALEGRRIYQCTPNMALKECTKDMDSDTWNAYHIMSNRARSVCYAARQQQFRALTQMAVNKLMSSSFEQLEFIKQLKEEQEELGSLASATLGSVTKGQERLLEQQEQLRMTQQKSYHQITSTVKELSRERAAAVAGQKELMSMSENLKKQLDSAAALVVKQESDRKVAQEHLLESLENIEQHVGDLWSELENSVGKLIQQQEQAVNLQTQTVKALERLNGTVQFLLHVAENSKEQLGWIHGLVGQTEQKLGKLSVWLLHLCYLLFGMLMLSFLQAPSYTRVSFLFIVPVNLAMDLQQGHALDPLSLSIFLLLTSLVFRLCKALIAKYRKSRVEYLIKEPVYPLPSQEVNETRRELNESSNDSSLSDDCLLSTRDSRSSTPLPSINSLHHASINSILLDRLENDSFTSVTRRSSRIATSHSFREGSVTPVFNQSLSRSGTPRRSMTPRRNCSGKCVDGSECRNAALRDSPYCRHHIK